MEKGLTYYDLAENDYQFLLKDWQEGVCTEIYKNA